MYSSSDKNQGYDPLHDGPEMGPTPPQPKEQFIPPTRPEKSNDFLGFRQPVQRVLAGLITLVLLVVVVLALRMFTGNQPLAQKPANQLKPGITPTITLSGPVPDLANIKDVSLSSGIPRLAQIHTILPTRPRNKVTKYTVQAGDTVIGIAQKFGLKPETILWGNYFTLLDNPSFLAPDEELNILPVDGVYHKWSAGEGLNGVASYYGVTPEEIVNFPANNLTMDTVGDLGNPNIKPDTWLVIPGGTREFIDWSAPPVAADTTNSTGGVAASCGIINGGAKGVGYFVWPANHHYLSGFDYTPSTNHLGIDVDGETGDPVYATDNGVVVYAGWNEYGYGNEVVINHGNGWQSRYAHLSQIGVECGQSVNQGQVIGLIGSTGRSSGSHLHFELISDIHGKVNPHDYLPPS